MNNTPQRAPLALRLAGGVVFLGLLGVVLLWNLAFVAFPSGPLAWLPPTVFLAMLLLLAVAAWKKVRLLETPASVGVGAAVLLAVVLYLAWDDPKVNHPLTMDELAPPPAREAAESHEATLAYSKRPESAEARRLPVLRSKLRSLREARTEDLEKIVTANPDDIAADFAASAEERAWLAALDRFAEIGDTPQPDLDSPLISWSALRQTGMVLCAEAIRLAQAGRGDEAAEQLRLLLSVSMKLERHARSDVRIMAATTSLQRGLATTGRVLAIAPVSAEQRAALAAAIAGRDEADTRRRLAWINYVVVTEMLQGMPDSAVTSLVLFDSGGPFWAKLFAWTRPLTVLPRQTANLLAEISAAVERTLAEPGEPTLATDGARLMQRLQSRSPKNFGGRALLMIAVPSYGKLAERLRETEQARQALLAQLGT